MTAFEYFEAVRKAYIEGKPETIPALAKKFGQREVTLEELEELVGNVAQTLAGFQIALENKEQIHFDLLVDMLEDAEALTRDQAQELRDEDENLKKQIEGAINND